MQSHPTTIEGLCRQPFDRALGFKGSLPSPASLRTSLALDLARPLSRIAAHFGGQDDGPTRRVSIHASTSAGSNRMNLPILRNGIRRSATSLRTNLTLTPRRSASVSMSISAPSPSLARPPLPDLPLFVSTSALPSPCQRGTPRARRSDTAVESRRRGDFGSQRLEPPR